MRVTEKMIEQKMLTLNAILKRPAQRWNTGAEGNVMNIGHLLLDHTGYGYRLVEICSTGGSERAWSDVMQTKRQILEYLTGVMNGITLRNELTYRDARGGSFE